MLLEMERVILRPFIEDDLEDLYEYSSQPGVGEMAGWKHHSSMAESRLALTENISNPDIFAIEYKENKKVIGHLAIHRDSENNREDTKELGCVLNQSYQRRGIMTEVIREILKYLSSNGIKHVYACCFQENIPSRLMIEKCGFAFEQEGTFHSKSLDQTFRSYEYVCHLQL